MIDQADVFLRRELAHLAVSGRVRAQPIGVELYRFELIRTVIPLVPRNLLDGKLNQGQGVSPAGPEDFGVHGDVKVVLLAEALTEEGCVAALALTLTPDKDATPWRDNGSATHPSCGTAPYTPPRYFL